MMAEIFDFECTRVEAELSAKCFEIFRQAYAAFERGDMVEHERLRIAHKELAEQHGLLVEREGKSVH